MKYVYGIYHNYLEYNSLVQDILLEEHGLFRSKEDAIRAIKDSKYRENIIYSDIVKFRDTKLNLTNGNDMTFCEFAIAPRHLSIAGATRYGADVYYIKKLPLR